MTKKMVATGLMIFGVLAFFLVAVALPAAGADDVTEKILDILHERGDITDQEYEDLKEQAKEEEAAEKESRGFKTYFDKRLHIDSPDGRFRFRIGGRLLIDAAGIDADHGLEAAADAAGETFQGTGTEFRQARLHIKGLLYDQVAFKNEFDFAGGDVSFKENWIEFQGLPRLGKMRVGHTKEPFSLERLNSRMYMPFMERALPDGIVPGRNTGIRFLNFVDEPRLSWSFGVFKETDGNGDDFSENGDYNITGRLTATPWYADEGRKVLHLGLGYSHKFTNDELRFRKRPELHISDLRPADTDDFPANGADMIGPEAALVLGPFCLQGEYWYAQVDSGEYDDPGFSGYYLTASYFLTGEHRKYELTGNDGAEFSQMDINTFFDPRQGGWGTWQVALRYADLDLNDNGLHGGEMDDITLALNWYPWPNLRWSFNYVHLEVEDSFAEDDLDIDDADAEVFQTRLQIYF